MNSRNDIKNPGPITLDLNLNNVSDNDFIFAATGPGAMSPEQTRLFLIFILTLIDQLIIDPRQFNILKKLQTNELITDKDRVDAENFMKELGSITSGLPVSMISRYPAFLAASRAVFYASKNDVREASYAVNMASSWDLTGNASEAVQANWLRENVKGRDSIILSHLVFDSRKSHFQPI